MCVCVFLEVSLTRRARASKRGERRKRRKRSARLDEISKTSRRYLDQKSALFSLLFFSLSSFVNLGVSFFCERTDKTETDRQTDRQTEGRISKKNNCSKSCEKERSNAREFSYAKTRFARFVFALFRERKREREREKETKKTHHHHQRKAFVRRSPSFSSS